ncbi:hypothetical protein COS31_04980 [Candidatus Roizmanbacteria bacterium CG02_land_8_20_14_3_00_36_15]|nr:MAG: hypothetical protein COS31_04980 [Candidatus Roizmanbacteria bacterium CG02_land_8_20_14_3_00_36_15]
MLSEVLIGEAQRAYHNAVVQPFRTNFFRNLSRLDHLQWKRHFPWKSHILEHDKHFKARIGHGGLSPIELAELTYLQTIWRIKSNYGNQPFGNYPMFYLEREGLGTRNRPYKPAYGYEIFDAIPGLLMLASRRKGGIFFEPNRTRGYDPLIHLTRDFEFEAASVDLHPDCLLSLLMEKALEHPELMKRDSKNGFLDTIKWYRTHAAEYAASISQAISKDQIEGFSKLVLPNGKILDVGAGAGRDEEVLKQLGFQVTGLDLVYELLKIAHQLNPDLLQINADMFFSPFPDNFFDGLWIHASLHHLNSLTDFSKVMDEMTRILRPNGIIHIASQAKTDKLRTALAVDELTRTARQYLYITAEELREMLVKRGFVDIDVKQHRESDDMKGTHRKAVEWLVALARKS